MRLGRIGEARSRVLKTVMLSNRLGPRVPPTVSAYRERIAATEARILSHDTAMEPATAKSDDDEPNSRLTGWLTTAIEFCQRWLDPTKRRALLALFIRIFGAAIAYGMQIVLAQWMGLTEYGIFVAVWVWLLVLGGIVPLGFNVSIIGMLSKFHDAGDYDQWRGVMRVSFAVTITGSLLVAGLGWTLFYFFPGILGPAYLMPVWLCLFCIPLMAIGEINDGISRAHGWINTALMPLYLLRPLLLIGGSIIAIQSGATLDAALTMSIAIMACLLTVIVQSTVLTLRLAKVAGRGPVVAQPRAWIIASSPIIVTQTFELLTQNFDLMAVSYFLGPENTGIYFAALKTIALLAFVNFAVGAATANNVASLHAAGRNEELGDLLNNATNLTFWPTLLGAAVLVTVAPVLLLLFGKDFAGHAYLTAILAVGFVAKGFVGPAELYLNVLGQQRTCAVILLAAAAVNITLNIALIPVFGLAGAAVATALSLFALSIGLFLTARKKLGILLMPSLPIPQFLSGKPDGR